MKDLWEFPFKCEIRHSFSVSLRALVKGLREEIISSYILRLC